MEAPQIDFGKYQKLADRTFFKKMGKIVNVVGLTMESAGPDAKLGDLCRILPEEGSGYPPILAEVMVPSSIWAVPTAALPILACVIAASSI